MNFISVMSVTEEIAREQASTKTGYAPETIGRVALVIEQSNSSRQTSSRQRTTSPNTHSMQRPGFPTPST